MPAASTVRLPAPADSRARQFARDLGLSTTVATWLLRQGHSDAALTQRFLEPKLADLSSPDQMAGRRTAALRLAKAIAGDETICVFGDYDCDGITATAILTEMLRALGGRVAPLLASRFAGGYGLSRHAVERIVATRASVLVTCDCGSSDHPALFDLGQRGIDAIVIDHHLVPDEPLPVLAFLNPQRKECGFGYKWLASCGLALSTGAAVRAELGRSLDLKRWLDLVAIGTIADVAPLDGDNRSLVRAGLGRLVQTERPGLRALFELGNIRGSSLTARDVAFRIAPRLNAPGRLGAPDLTLNLLLATDEAEARALAAKLEQSSQERKALQESLLTAAIEEIEREAYHRRSAIVLGSEGWNHGIVGIVAGRLAEKYRLPVMVCGFEGKVGRGSLRGPRGFRLYDALAEIRGSLVRFGGHQAAAGMELEFSRLAEVRAGFEAACEKIAQEDAARLSVAPEREDLLRLDPADEPISVMKDLDRLEPCGEKNPRPCLAIEATVISTRAVNGGHLKLELGLGAQRRLDCFSIGLGDRAEALMGSEVVVLGDLRYNTWRGGDSVELFADKIFDRRELA